MPRPRKIASEQKGHIMSDVMAKKERETQLALGDSSVLKRVPKKLLQDKVAAQKWRYIIKVKEDSKTLSNSDFDSLVVYCNAWSNYVKSAELMKSADPEMVQAALRMEKQAVDILYRYGARLGLDINSRLKLAALQVEKEQDAIKEEFGDI